MVIESTILKLQKSFLYNFEVEDKIWLNGAGILVVKGAGGGGGDDLLSSAPGLSGLLPALRAPTEYFLPL